MSNEPLQVSDWSQKYKIAIFLSFFVCAIVFGYFFLEKLQEITFLLQVIASKN